jgi:hypothetical protein
VIYYLLRNESIEKNEKAETYKLIVKRTAILKNTSAQET